MNKNKIIKYSLCYHLCWWIITIVFIKLLTLFPEIVELLYAKNIYPLIAIVNRWIAKLFPFSIGDFIYFWGISYLIYQILKLFIQIKTSIKQIKIISGFLLKTIWIFYFSWGINYYRQPLAEILHLDIGKYNLQQLLVVTQKIIDRTNELQIKLAKIDTLPVQVPYSLERILQKTPVGYEAIENIIKESYKVPCIKPSLFSKQISYMHVSGYLNPFTGEAQINKFYPKIFLPDIASHEVAHQLGFASENEANFLGYLAATHHPDSYFKYSGNIDVLYYLLIELKKVDNNLFNKYLKKINKGVLKSFKEANEFTKQYQSPINFMKGYDTYLKLNNQKTGIKSYNEMLKLLIAYEIK